MVETKPKPVFTVLELCRAYPDFDLLGVPYPEPDETYRHYRRRLVRLRRGSVRLGDGLLSFLLSELSETEDCESCGEAAGRLERAIRQLSVVHEVIPVGVGS